jgi:hypothetical protein
MTIPLFPQLLDQLLKMITIGVQQDLELLKAVPDEKRREQRPFGSPTSRLPVH